MRHKNQFCSKANLIFVKVNLVDVKDYLKSQNIEFKYFGHAPVFTCEDVEVCEAYKSIRGIHSKNLFLKDRKSKIFYLVILPAEKSLNLANIEAITGNKIKFANEVDLQTILGLTKGAVSPFGLINDSEKQTKVLIDKVIWEADFVSFHPNINTATIELTGKDFQKYIKVIGNEYKLI